MTQAEFEALSGDWENREPKGAWGRDIIVHAKTALITTSLVTDRGTVALTAGDVVIRTADGKHSAVLPRALAEMILQPVTGHVPYQIANTTEYRVMQWPNAKRLEYEMISDPKARDAFFERTEQDLKRQKRAEAAEPVTSNTRGRF